MASRRTPAYAVSISQLRRRRKATAGRPIEVRLEFSYDERKKAAAVVTVLITVDRRVSRKKKSIKKAAQCPPTSQVEYGKLARVNHGPCNFELKVICHL